MVLFWFLTLLPLILTCSILIKLLFSWQGSPSLEWLCHIYMYIHNISPISFFLGISKLVWKLWSDSGSAMMRCPWNQDGLSKKALLKYKIMATCQTFQSSAQIQGSVQATRFPFTWGGHAPIFWFSKMDTNMEANVCERLGSWVWTGVVNCNFMSFEATQNTMVTLVLGPLWM